MYLRLSHSLNLHDHAFPGAPTMKLMPFEVIGKDGAVCNTFRVELFNHYGTHMDGPNHFDPEGKQLWQVPQEMFFSESPLLLDIPKGEGESVMPDELLVHDEAIKQADMLFLRSGFEAVRTEDNLRYSQRGPSVSAATAQLIVTRWPHLKAVGLDWISLSSPLALEDGIRAHQIMLGGNGNKPVLIIEVVALADVEADRLEQVLCVPLFIQGIDSAPVTIFAKMKDI